MEFLTGVKKQDTLEISQLLDFSDQPHFQNCFKRATGMTPWQYRNQNVDL